MAEADPTTREPPRNHNPLAVGRVVRHGHGREDRAGKVAIELVHEHGRDKRAFIDPFPSWRGVRRAHDGGVQGIAPWDGGPVRRAQWGRFRRGRLPLEPRRTDRGVKPILS